ncbi:hypothetical protein [Streptomyces violaceusniger]|uniref:Uncharacterized protein n=1 Tax=Streptomyces violaceusniger (strain Tu 4113) TaxID=653045 RepID=G2P7A6_STRV4|nr:hypothetical protein [Streptomyces violaceusniger]AEM87066.1 hypothetical protein Strvi_7731 [Streptomyces violaceusniger Tu 4113]
MSTPDKTPVALDADAVDLVVQILADVLKAEENGTYVRHTYRRIGELERGISTALTVITHLGRPEVER